ncbi:zinc finger SWIM domain-containing protein 8, partial [Caerostris extrusa]
MTRPPASTKALEVKLANQEQDLVLLLKRLPLLDKEMSIIRERAEQLRDGKLVSRGEALLPLMLASFIFDALTLSSDELLGFEAAVAALGLKANVSEAEHPLLCEGTRRQKRLWRNYWIKKYIKCTKLLHPLCITLQLQALNKTAQIFFSSDDKNVNEDGASKDAEENDLHDDDAEGRSTTDKRTEHYKSAIRPRSLPSVQNSTPGSSRSRDHRQSHRMHEDNGEHSEGASSPGWEEDYKAWEAKFRCTNFRTTKKHSGGMASIDSSAPETTSGDNSPTVVRRGTWLKQCGPEVTVEAVVKVVIHLHLALLKKKLTVQVKERRKVFPVCLLNNRLPASLHLQKVMSVLIHQTLKIL